MVRVLAPVVCCAFAPTAMVVLSRITAPAVRQRTIRSVNSFEFICTS
jgi:hypothetical protein